MAAYGASAPGAVAGFGSSVRAPVGTIGPAAASRSFFASTAFAGLSTTAAYIADPTQKYQAFYYLKISGLPYYFGSIIKPAPTDPSWGSYQWTLPDGYSWISGMDIPDGALEQKIADMIGGIASSERITLSMMDFDVHDANGAHSFFGRLLSPGRLTTSPSAVIGTLQSTLLPGSTSFLDVKGVNGAFAGGSPEVDTYVGGETIGVSAVSGPDPDLIYTLTIGTRNKYPCTANYPPRSSVVIPTTDTGAVDDGRAPLVTQGAPLSFLYRTAALYIGHFTPDGNPDIEANANCRLVGRLKSVNYGRDPGKFEFEIESVMSDLTSALVAPALARATVKDGLYLQAEQFRNLGVFITAQAGVHVAIQGAVYTIDNGGTNVYPDAKSVGFALSAIMNATPVSIDFGGGIIRTVTINLEVIPDSDGSKFVFFAHPSDVDFSFTITFSDVSNFGTSLLGARASLLRPLGFDGNSVSASVDKGGDPARLVSPRVVPSLFVPTEITGAGTTIDIIADASAISGVWFTNQGDSGGIAYVRFADGTVCQLLNDVSGTLTIGGVGTHGPIPGGCVYVEADGADSLKTIEQIVRLPSSSTTSIDHAMGQLLASTGFSPDGEYNVFPPGVGLGFDGILDKESLRAAALLFPGSFTFDVDGSTKFMDLWAPMAKEQGLFLVWDPANAWITLRSLVIPNYASSSTFQFTESNRPDPNGRSQGAIDTSNIRTGWTLRWGWDAKQKKFLGGEINIVNDRAANAFQVSSRVETIEDKIIPITSSKLVGEIAGSLADRFLVLSYPWTKVTRDVMKMALLLAPGTYHKIVDATIFNHFTGTQGIAASDNVYGWLMSVRSVLKTGLVTVTFLVDQQTDGSTLRPWSPTGKLNFVAGSNGYDNATGILTMDSFYCPGAGGLVYDGISFQVGDKVYLTTLDNPTGTPAYSYATTITAISADGSNVTVGAGLGAVSSTVETIMILQNWGAQTTDRKTGDHRTAFQGDGNALLIAGVARLHKWQ